MKNNSGWLVAIFVILLICVVGGVGIFAYRQRLGLSLTDPMPAALLTSTPRVSNVDLQATPLATSVAVQVATQLPPTAQGAVCGETAAWNILVLGSDLNETSRLRGSDLTRVMRVDFPNRKVIVYAFPRDLWVDTSGLGLTNPTINADQLGMVFYEARMRSPQFGVPEVMVDGLRVSAATILKNFSVRTDHYLALDLNQLPKIVDAVGGIPINIPERTTDLWRPIVFNPGQQTLNGEQTADYSRAYMGTDFDRIRRNQILLEAMRQKLLDPAVWAKIPELYTQFSAVIITDFTPEQITHLACLLKDVPPDSILQEGVRPEWTSPGPRGSLRWDQYSLFTRLKELGFVQ